MTRMRPIVAGILGWVIGAVGSVAVGLLALSLVGDDLAAGAPQPFGADVYAPRPSSTPPSAAPTPQPTATAAPEAQRRFPTPGGDVVARCRPAGAYLVYWSPAQGFRAHDVVRGPAEVAKVKFENGDLEIELKIRCIDGVPEASVKQEIEDEDHR